jgi:3-deoxy-manno-octulosonate cytidylyltransferase (CMP-KDO synthetase)
MKVLGIIPSRYTSTRFPGKAMVDIGGKTMIRRVYEQAIQCNALDKLIVATDDQRIFDEVYSFGGDVIMTSSDHLNGTERCNEVAQAYSDYDFIVNIQGDEPFVHPAQIDQLVATLTEDVTLATLVKKVSNRQTLHDPSKIKVVFNRMHEAMYFSRSIIPFERESTSNYESYMDYYQHIGLYAYRRDILNELSNLSPTPAEQAESLEQLRWLEHGYRIKIGFTTLESIMVDTPEDLVNLKEEFLK